MKSFLIIVASILFTCAMYNIMSANYANRVEARYIHVVPEKTSNSCVVYKMDGTTVIVIDDKVGRKLK
jgi:hypothetical protein